MSIILNATLSSTINWQRKDVNDDYSDITLTFTGKHSYVESLTDGTGVSEANNVWHDEDTITANSTTTLDFQALSQAIFSGSITRTFTGVQFLYLENTNEDSSGNLVIQATGSNAFTNLFYGGSGNWLLYPGSSLVFSIPQTGIQVTASNKYLYLKNTDNTDTSYRMVIIGRT